MGLGPSTLGLHRLTLKSRVRGEHTMTPVEYFEKAVVEYNAGDVTASVREDLPLGLPLVSMMNGIRHLWRHLLWVSSRDFSATIDEVYARVYELATGSCGSPVRLRAMWHSPSRHDGCRNSVSQ